MITKKDIVAIACAVPGVTGARVFECDGPGDLRIEFTSTAGIGTSTSADISHHVFTTVAAALQAHVHLASVVPVGRLADSGAVDTVVAPPALSSEPIGWPAITPRPMFYELLSPKARAVYERKHYNTVTEYVKRSDGTLAKSESFFDRMRRIGMGDQVGAPALLEVGERVRAQAHILGQVIEVSLPEALGKEAGVWLIEKTTKAIARIRDVFERCVELDLVLGVLAVPGKVGSFEPAPADAGCFKVPLGTIDTTMRSMVAVFASSLLSRAELNEKLGFEAFTYERDLPAPWPEVFPWETGYVDPRAQDAFTLVEKMQLRRRWRNTLRAGFGAVIEAITASAGLKGLDTDKITARVIDAARPMEEDFLKGASAAALEVLTPGELFDALGFYGSSAAEKLMSEAWEKKLDERLRVFCEENEALNGVIQQAMADEIDRQLGRKTAGSK